MLKQAAYTVESAANLSGATTVNLTKQTMIDNIRTKHDWLNAALLRLNTMSANNTLTLNEQERYDLNYWCGSIRVGRNLASGHLDTAVALATNATCTTALWDHVVSNNKGGTQ
jgi:hypothetical protein